MRRLAPYSDQIEKAPARLRALINKDHRIVGYTIEPDGCFIYTNSGEWCDESGSGTFSGGSVSEAIRRFKRSVRPASIAVATHCDQCGHEFSDSLGKYGCPNCAE